MEINPRKITILIGPNSSGKSSILQALLVLKESLHTTGNGSSALVTQTESFDLGKYEDVVTDHLANVPLSIGIEARKIMPFGLIDNSESLLTVKYNIEFINKIINFLYFDVESDDFHLMYQYKNKKTSIRMTDKNSNAEFPINGESGLDGIHPNFYGQSTNDMRNDNFNKYFANRDFTQKLLNEFYYIPYNRTATSYGVTLQRGNHEKIYSDPTFMISHMISKLSKDPILEQTVSDFISEISGKTIRCRNLDLPFVNNESGVTVDFSKKGISNSIINEGTGLNQLILLLSTLAESSDNSIIGIEEPELHLHPSAQSKLSKILIRLASSQKKQIIFTTHSEHMLYPFLAEVTKGKQKLLSKDDIAIYYIHQDENSNLSIIEHLPINEFGQIKGGLKGFWESDLEVFKQFSDKNE